MIVVSVLPSSTACCHFDPFGQAQDKLREKSFRFFAPLHPFEGPQDMLCGRYLFGNG